MLSNKREGRKAGRQEGLIYIVSNGRHIIFIQRRYQINRCSNPSCAKDNNMQAQTGTGT
jgi:hypothetical protein